MSRFLLLPAAPRRLTPLAAGLLALLAGGCTDTGIEPLPEEHDTVAVPGLVISEPSSVPAGAGALASAGTAGAARAAYVSAEPGTFPGAVQIRIRNLNTADAGISVTVHEGGFDPVGILASTGDRLELFITEFSGAFRSVHVDVPVRRPPVIVRTNPPKGRTDVAFSIRPVVIFSEPIDPQSLGETSITLLRGGLVVSGVVAPVAGRPFAVEFTPEAMLEPLAAYELVVTTAVQDLDGESLAEEYRVPFSTASATGAVGAGLAFVQDGTVFVSWLDGSAPVQLLTEAARPAWSPEGTRIAFTRPAYNRLEKWRVCVAREDGTDVRCATGERDGSVVGGPSWSPDGVRVAFSVWLYGCPNGQCGQHGGYFSGLLLLNTLSMEVESVNTPPLTSVTWSPDGRKIAFATFGSGRFGRGQLGTVNPDGSGGVILAQSFGSYSVREVAWSPDGGKLALTLFDEYACPWYCDTAIGTVNADGTDLKVLEKVRTLDQSNVGTPSWSPDGTLIAYTLTNGGECWYDHYPCGSDIVATGADGVGPDVILASGGFPSWRR